MIRISKPPVNIREKLAELERPIGLNGQALLATSTPQEAFSLIGAGRRNLIINGDFKISQRATDSGNISLITVDGYRTVDRWKDLTYNNSGTFTPQYRIRQFADHPISGAQGYCLRYDCVTADTPATNVDFLSTFQQIESNNTINLYNNYSSVSFWVKSSSPGPYSVQIRASGAVSASTPNLLLKYNINNSNVWEYKTLLVPPQNLSLITGGNGTGYALHFVLSSGLNKNYDANVATIENKWGFYSSNGVAFIDQTNLMATAGNYWQITNIQLEVGKVATPFEYRSYGQELALCQRYYETGFTKCYVLGGSGIAVATNFKVQKRTTPTQTYSAPPGGMSNQQPTANEAITVDGFSALRSSANEIAFSWVSSAEL